MTGPEHYLEAERLTAEQMAGRQIDFHQATVMLAAAQVHATLALAAATALSESAQDEAEWMKVGASVWKPMPL